MSQRHIERLLFNRKCYAKVVGNTRVLEERVLAKRGGREASGHRKRQA